MRLRRQRDIDLRQQPPRRWGEPGPCPKCDGDGFLDRLDMIDRVAEVHCVDCGHKWSEREGDVALLYKD